MKVIIIFSVIIGVAFAASDMYTTKYDNIDLQEIIKSKRLVKNYANCLLSTGNCSTDGLELKKALPDALRNECAKCSKKQKHGSVVIFKHLIDNEPELWAQLEKVYDPTGDYVRKYRQKAKKEGINL